MPHDIHPLKSHVGLLVPVCGVEGAPVRGGEETRKCGDIALVSMLVPDLKHTRHMLMSYVWFIYGSLTLSSPRQQPATFQLINHPNIHFTYEP